MAILIFLSLYALSGYYQVLACYHECCEYRIFDCRRYQEFGYTASGVYHVTPRNMLTQYEVYCDMETDGGGWMVFQRRVNGSVDFNRSWEDYAQGFGDVKNEHWLGLELMKRTMYEEYYYELRIDLEDWERNTAYAKYNRFWISEHADNYRLTVWMYTGTANDALKYHNDKMFTTIDRDNDEHDDNCAIKLKGGWWFEHCKHAHLNGLYKTTNFTNDDNGILWHEWKGDTYSLKHTEMKIRRL